MPIHQPTFRVVANGDDITAAIRERLVSLSITDEAGMESDSLTIDLADTAPHIRLPSTGAEVRVWLGYKPAVEYMGLYVVDGLTLSGPPNAISIKASGAPFERSKGYSQLQTRRTRSWTPRTVGELVKEIAGVHGLRPAVADSLSETALQHLDQMDESDMHLLTRVAKEHGAIAKANGGALLFVKQGEGKTVSGKVLPTITVTPEDVTSWTVDISGRTNYRSVVAIWRDVASAKDVEETVGEGEPVMRIRNAYPNKEAARHAARSKLDAFQSGKRTLSLTMPGNPSIRAESRLMLSGFRVGVAGEWSVIKATHKLGSGGYVTEVEGNCLVPHGL